MCMQVSRITDIITDADSLRLRFPKLASMKPESGSLHLTFLNLAAQLKFSVAIPLGEHKCCLALNPWTNSGLLFGLQTAVSQSGHAVMLCMMCAGKV